MSAKDWHPYGEGPYGLGALLVGDGRLDGHRVVSHGFQNPHRVADATHGEHANGIRWADYTTACGLTGRAFNNYGSCWSSVHRWHASQFVCALCWSGLPGTPAAKKAQRA